MRRALTVAGFTLALLALLAAWADSTPVASLLETRPLAAGAAMAAVGLLAWRAGRCGSTPAVVVGLGVGFVALVWSLQLLLFAYRTEGLIFEDGGARLVGTLYLPRSVGPHPAVVFLHGSGPARGRAFASQAKLFARHGIAALVYDKRGSGASTGHLWVPYERYAGDAVAARRALAGHPAIDGRRVGYFGHSEGGWVAPLAASESGCGFLIASGTTHRTPADQVVGESLTQVAAAGFGPSVLARVEALQRDLMTYQRGGGARDGLAADLEAASAEAWAPPAELPDRLWPLEEYAWWRSVMDFDPLPFWRRVECPVLLVSGGRDTRSNVRESQALIRAAITATGRPEVTTAVFPAADHMVLEWPLGGRIAPPRWPDGYPELLVCWTLGRTGLPAGPECEGGWQDALHEGTRGGRGADGRE